MNKITKMISKMAIGYVMFMAGAMVLSLMYGLYDQWLYAENPYLVIRYTAFGIEMGHAAFAMLTAAMLIFTKKMINRYYMWDSLNERV